jgi:hypothetical protein
MRLTPTSRRWDRAWGSSLAALGSPSPETAASTIVLVAIDRMPGAAGGGA